MAANFEENRGTESGLPKICVHSRSFAVAPAFGLLNQLFDVLENPPHQFTRRVRLIERDVISDRIEITEGWLRPDQPSHRARRFLAAA